MKERKAVTKQLATTYNRAPKKEKGKILDTLIDLAGYNRSYAARVLRQRARSKRVRKAEKKTTRCRPRKYGREVLVALRKIWVICDCICGKRLAPYLPEIIPVLERCGELAISEEVRQKLLEISPATVDRLLASVKKQYQLKARSTTKPGTLLKHQIPIRTYSEWDEQRPGFVEVDLVSHEGGDSRGDFIQTLDVTDVHTGWTETKAVKNKAQVWVFEALKEIKEQLPFDLLGIDSDNGSEFINGHLLSFCREQKITFTRSRPYRKNDNCFVEQKNYSVVRKAVGYRRHDTEEELAVLNELYDTLRLYTNFFQPVMKLIEKTRVGSKVKKRYDRARTPFRRVLESSLIAEQTKEELNQEYVALNPVVLQREIMRLQDRLSAVTQSKRNEHKENQNVKTLEYILT
jgi:hypothetical protein